MESARDVVRQTMALVLAGGRGSRLKALTDTRAKPQFILEVSSELSTLHCLTVLTLVLRVLVL